MLAIAWSELPLNGVGIMATAMVSAFSWWTSKRTQRESARREDVEQALEAQRRLLALDAERIERLEVQNRTCETQLAEMSVRLRQLEGP